VGAGGHKKDFSNQWKRKIVARGIITGWRGKKEMMQEAEILRKGGCGAEDRWRIGGFLSEAEGTLSKQQKPLYLVK